MHNDRTAKLRRRGIALDNTRLQLQAWKDAKTDEQILSLLSTKNLKALGDNPTSENLKLVRKAKIDNSTSIISTLESRV